MKLGSIIKYYRLKNHMTQSELAQDICSISHLSKIENNSYDGNAETVELLLKKLNVNMEKEEEKYEDIKELLQDFYQSMVYYDIDEANRICETLINMEEFASSTDLINQYHLYMYKYYILNRNIVKINQCQRVIEKLQSSFSPFENVLASFLFGVALIGQNKVLEANDQFVALMSYNQTEAITFNGELYYQIALCASILNDAEKSIIQANKALDIYQNENNLMRIIHTKMLLGIGYSRLEMFEEASENYKTLIRLTKLLNKKDIYYHVLNNYSTMLNEKGEYKKAKELMIECTKYFKRGSIEYIVNKLGLIEILINMDANKEEINKLIDEVHEVCNNKNHKKYIMLAKMFKYKLFSQPKYYAYLENIVYSYHIDNYQFNEARDVALQLAKRFQETGEVDKSLDYYNKYIELSERSKKI
ncbi:helix-turn-helix domain-containing protein [Peribacillus sp. SCS-37]|uniref:helix-turn-helix domain-containing protein n=1 Tax=Paraperibacillus esterisolvens TaxID=3115296 RepID=UPI003906BB47